AACDAVVIVAGLDHRQDTEGVDRPDYRLPDGQDAVIARILEARPDATVVLTGGGPSALPWADRVRTLLWAGYGGAAAGTALARVLCGDVEPRGRLPFTWWRELADCPAHRHGEHREGVCHYRDDLCIGYRGVDRDGTVPLFPFGHGGGWTRIEYSDPAAVREGGHIRIRCRLANPGPRDAVEVVQVYARPPAAPAPRPAKELRAFAPVAVPAGGSALADLTVAVADLARWEPGTGWVVDPGRWRFAIAASAADLRLETALELG
ncbi:MAG: hypothetical protein RLZZ127_552, partial [Planctomycetota bacterium]